MREPPLTQPVHADQRIDRKTLLGYSTSVLKRRCRGLHAFYRDVVAQRLQSGYHISLETRIEQRELRFVTQLGDVFAKRHRDHRHDSGSRPPSRAASSAIQRSTST